KSPLLRCVLVDEPNGACSPVRRSKAPASTVPLLRGGAPPAPSQRAMNSRPEEARPRKRRHRRRFASMPALLNKGFERFRALARRPSQIPELREDFLGVSFGSDSRPEESKATRFPRFVIHTR